MPAEIVGFEPLVRMPVATKSNVVAQKRLAFVLDWSGTAFTPVPEALGPAPQRMWLRGALRQCGGWRRTNLKEDPNAQAQIGTHKNIALAQEQDCSPQIRDAVESPVIDHGRQSRKQTSPAYYNAPGVVGCDGCRDDGGHGMAAALSSRFSRGCHSQEARLNLVSEASDDGRIYRIKDRKRRTVSVETAQTA